MKIYTETIEINFKKKEVKLLGAETEKGKFASGTYSFDEIESISNETIDCIVVILK